MIFVVNSVFENNIKESTTKEDILKMMPDIYENAQRQQKSVVVVLQDE